MTDIFRLLVVLLLVIHATWHLLWFLAAWTKVATGVKDEAWLLPGEVRFGGIAGRVTGLIALALLIAFVSCGLALLLGQSWWRGVAQIGAYVSLVTIFPWARVSPRSITINAMVGDLVLLFLLALPLSTELIEPT